MPCNIGYKSYTRIEIPIPQPQIFKAKADAPNIDADLLAKLGNEDPEFLEWARDLDIRPLLEEALKRTLAKISAEGIDFVVNAEGMLEATGKFFNAKEKKRLAEITSRVSSRWQFEILGIVAQLLDYSVIITQRGNEFVLEAEEEGKSHPCDYIKVTKTDSDASIVFEHFKSRRALELAMAKFMTLAHRLGVKIALGESTLTQGDPFPGEERHHEAHMHGHGHHHDGHNHEHEY